MTMMMADKYDDDENVRALDQLNTFPFYGIIGIRERCKKKIEKKPNKC